MWMMGCSDMTDSFNGRKLRPLMPRPTSNGANTSHINGTDLFSLNTHLASVTEQSKKEFSAQPVVSSRWNPTPEQLRALEELYRRGTRTPTADQIQHITAQLRRFGKIEGKNVFYWFQNHKARERQKRRRRLESAADEQQRCDIESLGRKESGGSRTGFEVEQTRNWAPPTNCSKLAEESVSLHKAAVAESRGELQQRRSSIERHATWQMMRLSCSPPTHLINTIATATTDPKLVHNQNLNIFTTSNRVNLDNLPCMGAYQNREECGESQTLELFPLRSDNDNGADDAEKGTELPIPTMNSDFTSYQFFEFLPLKN